MADDAADSPAPADLIEAARRVIEANRAAGRKIAVAESCTGGLVAAALTEIPGASDVFLGGVVSYANEAKMNLLGVSESVISTFGAVSIAVAWAMARGAAERFDADCAVAITGVAGPSGGTERKPVGTVVFARAERGANPEDIHADSKLFNDDGRTAIRRHAVLCALELLMPQDSPTVGDGESGAEVADAFSAEASSAEEDAAP